MSIFVMKRIKTNQKVNPIVNLEHYPRFTI